MNLYERELTDYKKLNSIAKKNSVIVFGSTFMKNIPFSELCQTFNCDSTIYNRSFADLSVFDAEDIFRESVLPLFPKKILLGLGETDLEHDCKTIPEIIKAYEKLIDFIKSTDKRCKIVIVSVCENADLQPVALNRQLEVLAHKKKCSYSDITSSVKNSDSKIIAFNMLKMYALDKVSFFDVISAYA